MFTIDIVKRTLENENSKWTKTSLEIVCDEKKAQWMSTLFHCKGKNAIVRMLARTPRDLDLYPTMDHIQMKVVTADYNVRVGYWASRNNVEEYKVYVTMIWMFDLDFVNDLWQAPRDNPCQLNWQTIIIGLI